MEANVLNITFYGAKIILPIFHIMILFTVYSYYEKEIIIMQTFDVVH